ncbi:YhcN/YlaJ family sporulation lipoprotein [Peribacillus sp. SCS-155]|uniref:YhcN/YlaJ family sporulation lipoprotein n=1 Tax=Peribacillus sedimenti TaxID=3115297 RepID=UPI0039061630
MKRAALIIMLYFILSACTNNGTNGERPGVLDGGQDNPVEEHERHTNQKTADRLVEMALGVPGVNNATAIVMNHYIIVGIDVDGKLNGPEAYKVKRNVAKALKNHPFGERVEIVADPDISDRLKKVSVDIKEGKPLRGILNELSDIEKRITPESTGDG